MGSRLRGPFPSGEFVQVIAERAIGGESLLVEQPLGAAAEANLIRISLAADRPAHLAVPAASERQHGRPSQAAGHDSGPPPAGFLEFFWFLLLDSVGHSISGNCICCYFKIGRFEAESKILRVVARGFRRRAASAGRPRAA